MRPFSIPGDYITFCMLQPILTVTQEETPQSSHEQLFAHRCTYKGTKSDICMTTCSSNAMCPDLVSRVDAIPTSQI